MFLVNEDMIRIEIYCPFNLNLKLSKIIRERLNVSLNELSHLIEENILSISNVENWKKDKVKNNTVITMDVEKLSLYRFNVVKGDKNKS